MVRARFNPQRLVKLLGAGVLLAVTLGLLWSGAALAQDNAVEITPSFGDGKLKILGAGFKPNENVTIVVKIDRGTFTFNATANAQGEFQLDTGLEVPPLSSVELEARGDQGSGGASITSVPPALPLPQAGAAMYSVGVAILAGLLLLLGGVWLATRGVADRSNP